MGLWARCYDIFIICNRRHFMMLGGRPAGTRKAGKPKAVVEEGTGEVSHRWIRV